MKQVVLILCLFPIYLSAQTDYTEIKDAYIRTCGQMDSISVFKNVAFVDSVAKLHLEKGEAQFLQDYGWAYYRKYGKTKAQSDLIVAINCYERSWEKFHEPNSLFQAGSMYAGFDCAMCKKYIDLFLDISKESEIDLGFYNSQIEIIKEICPE